MGGQISSPKAAPAMEPQAKALCDVLEAIFDYADANLEPKGLGLMPIEKLYLMAEKAGMFDLSELYKIIPVTVIEAQYRITGCQFCMLPPYGADASPYIFREPTHPALTKPGWIRSEVISLILGTEEDDLTYRTLQGIIANCDLRIKNQSDKARPPEGRHLPLPDMPTVRQTAISLEPFLFIEGVEIMSQRMQAEAKAWLEKSQLQPSHQSNREPSPELRGVAGEFLEEINQLLEDERERALLDASGFMADVQTLRNAESSDMMGLI